MAIQCNASDIHLRSSQAMGLNAQSPFSITTWINAVWNPGTGATRSLVGIYGPATDVPLGAPVTALQIGTSLGTGDLAFWTWGGADMCTTAAGVMTPFNNTWVFIAYTYDGSTHRGYLNGTQVCTGTTAQQPGIMNQVYINGYPGTTTSEVHNHAIDQYALYRRTLSANEIATMYAAQGTRHGIMDGAVCRYEFDELAQGANVAVVVDLSGNGHTLTTFGAGTPMTFTYPGTIANSNIRPVQ